MADEPTRNVRIYEQKPSKGISAQTIIMLVIILAVVGYLLSRVL